ncbi:MAG: SOS response-associated peptidase, partial [Anaerolineales bacterium]|nr:SOS response-associated peptidase [Anaerolineales bacterium]
QELFGLSEPAPADLTPRYNIAPSQPVAIVPNREPRRLELFRWGLIPSWAKDPKIGNSLINARAETAAEKPAFRAAFRRRRCLIPADGFYEWKK